MTASNSLVGSTAEDRVGISGTALANGNYVVGEPDWDNGAIAERRRGHVGQRRDRHRGRP